MSGPISLIPILPIVLIALLANFLCFRVANRFGKARIEASKYPTIDGLRGYLALFVFVHHSSFWFSFREAGQWLLPASRIYLNLGVISVSLFFMITAFLFADKIMASPSVHQRDFWLRLYVSRVFRIFPVYFFAIGLMFVIVGIHTHWTLASSVDAVLRSIASWMTFTFAGRPNINDLANTARITAGVTWTLPYEWAFYLLLPVCALAMRKKPPFWVLLVSASVSLLFGVWKPELQMTKPFVSGIAAAVLVRQAWFTQFAQKPVAGILVVAALLTAMLGFDSAFTRAPTFMLACAFGIVAGGNTLFGALSSRSSRFLGQPTYSMYLLHGLVLWVTFRFVFTAAQAAEMSSWHFWLVVCAITPVLVVVSHASYRGIERPFMRLGKRRAADLRAADLRPAI